MQTITVVKQFILQLDPKPDTSVPMIKDGEGHMVHQMSVPEKRLFVPGVHDVEDDVAEHWYVKLHLAGFREPAVAPGMPEYQAKEAAQAAPEMPEMPEATQPMPQDASTRPRMAAPPPSATRSIPRSPGLVQGVAQGTPGHE